MFDKYNGFSEFYGDVCEDIRCPVERKLAVMKKGRNVAFGGGKGSAPDSNPGMIASADAAKEIAKMQQASAKEALDFYKQQYADLKPTLEKVMNSQVASQEANDKRAGEYAEYEKNTFRPLEQKLVDQANAYNTDAKREELARTASADVGQAMEGARGQLGRQMASAGIRANSGRFAALNNQMITQEALAKAGAQNNARTQAEQLGYARMQDAAGLGRGLASNASTAYSVGIQAGNSANQNAMTSGNIMGQGYQAYNSGMAGATNSYGTAGNIYGQEFNARMQGYNAQQQSSNAMWSGLGQVAGMAGSAYIGGMMKKADGGRIRGLRLADGTHVGAGPVSGPGGPVDDKIPAMLSNGEYVLPADTVAKIGVGKLDKVVRDTHTPAAEQRQRQRKRKALKGRK